MQIVINGRLDLDADELLQKRGLEDDGYAQRWLDNECIKLMDPYTPDRNGILKQSIRINTVIGSGLLKQSTLYVRYQYYGVLMVSSITGSAWASAGEKKVLTNPPIPLKYSTAKSPLAGKMWFERMKADKKDELLEGLRKVVDK